MTESEWNAKFKRTKNATIKLLKEIEKHTGYGYIPHTSINVSDKLKEDPSWCGGVIKIGRNHEPEAIAHELAHGHHEGIRKERKKREGKETDEFGEDFCEAIRYYVEKRMSTGSDWFNKKNKSDKMNVAVIKKWPNLGGYKAKLKSGELFTEIVWS